MSFLFLYFDDKMKTEFLTYFNAYNLILNDIYNITASKFSLKYGIPTIFDKLKMEILRHILI